MTWRRVNYCREEGVNGTERAEEAERIRQDRVRRKTRGRSRKTRERLDVKGKRLKYTCVCAILCHLL